MNCHSIQNRILALPDPRQVPAALREHLNGCPGCTSWWQQAVRLERLLEQLPVPSAPADKKVVLLDDLAAAGPVIRTIPVVERPPGRSIFETVRSVPGLTFVAALAAAVLIVVGGWMVIRPGPGTPPIVKERPRDPFLEKLVQRDLALAQAKTADQRLEVLAALADDLSTEITGLARIADPEELRDLSGLFQKVVNEGIVQQAAALPPLVMTPTQKQALFERLTTKLGEAGQQADRAARESPPHAQPALKTISDTARDGQAKLKAILGA